MTEKQLLKFIDEILKLEEIEFIGIAKILGVALITEEGEPRDFADIFKDMMDRFEISNRKARRQLLKMIEDSNKLPREV